jgi:hypothetical protein
MRGGSEGRTPDQLGDLLQKECSGNDHRAGHFHSAYLCKIYLIELPQTPDEEIHPVFFYS